MQHRFYSVPCQSILRTEHTLAWDTEVDVVGSRKHFFRFFLNNRNSRGFNLRLIYMSLLRLEEAHFLEIKSQYL